ncbi:beta strand repeat-containing protein [Aerosakkonema funiforme]|uniref:S-layer family protein n=1 Tax=Aerosakkonema funiforme FACHB-1375 TaxID=2949571 RepID=A0A926ZJA6_9CYAN|nr:S-layer family protein [Aerosakkonema funiforme]MBD2185348.1 S-layer family protein [Aerosakkonema funiforme FACHB-1375]
MSATLPKLAIYFVPSAVLNLLAYLYPAVGQIIPDRTLGSENSQVVPNVEIKGVQSDRIDGGAMRGSNLFHSLQEFNIPEGRGAYFSNPDGIINILTRVTGGNPANIFGTLGVLGNANLFLINPRGIVFGPNARLDLRGSFLASSADSIVFENSFEFSASNPSAPPLLTINIPNGLRFRDRPGSITVLGSGHNLQAIPKIGGTDFRNRPVGLQVDRDRTLALVGGEITIAGGNLTAPAGQIELGSIGSEALVKLTPLPSVDEEIRGGGWAFDYTGIDNFQDIRLIQAASAITVSDKGGPVNLTGRQITVTNGSAIHSSTDGAGAAGSITVRGTETIEVSGFAPSIYPSGLFADVRQGATGKGGKVTIETARLLLAGGGQISSGTFGQGNGSTLTVRASDAIEIIANLSKEPFPSGLYTTAAPISSGNGGDITIATGRLQIVGGKVSSDTLGQGNGGNLTIEAQQLRVEEGGQIGTGTYDRGNGGNLTIRASESVELIGFIDRFPSGIFSAVTPKAVGQAGNLTVETKRLRLENGGRIASDTLGQGNGGNLTVRASESVELIGASATSPSGFFTSVAPGGVGKAGNLTVETARLRLEDGAQISAGVFGKGDGSNLTVRATEAVEVSGKTAKGNPSALFASVLETGVGKGGNVTIVTERLQVDNGGVVGVSDFSGTGGAGTLTVAANSILLDRGILNAQTKAGNQGNIELSAGDIQLRQGSMIEANALGSATGGNVTLNSDILLGFPGENSDITANAQTAQGGRVTVNVPNIFGIASVDREQLRDNLGLTDAEFAALQVNPTFLLSSSDISAISQTAGPDLQGTVTFSTAGVNPAQGLVELPQNIVDPAALIAANPCTQGAGSEFTITGRGGLPPSPNDLLDGEVSQFNWVEPAVGSGEESQKSKVKSQNSSLSFFPLPSPIPAQGWVIDGTGEVTLVAYNPGNPVSDRTPKSSNVCLPR